MHLIEALKMVLPPEDDLITEIHKFNENTPEFFEKLDKLSEDERRIFVNALFFKRLNSQKDDGRDFQFLTNQIRKNA
jgi:hypothetical protein